MLSFRHFFVSLAVVVGFCNVASYTFAAPLNQVAAVVNGEMITLFDVQSQSAPELLKAGLNPSLETDTALVKNIYKNVLDSMIAEELIMQEAERLQITAKPEEVENEFRRLVQQSQLSEEDFTRQLRMQGLSAERMREQLKKNILKHRLLSHMIARKVVVSPTEIKTYYENHKEQFVAERKVHLGLIVFAPTADVATLATKAQQGGFAEVAASNSIGPNAQNAGDIGEVNWDDLAMEWREALTGLQPGDVSDVILVDGRKALIQLISTTDGTKQSLEQAEAEIEAILREPKLQERFKEYMTQLRSKAVIDIRM